MNAIIVGGSSGIGLSIAVGLLDICDGIIIFDKKPIDYSLLPEEYKSVFESKVKYKKIDLSYRDLSIVSKYVNKTDALFLTAGFGRVSPFENLNDVEINNLITVDLTSQLRIIKMFYSKMQSKKDFYACAMGSIAGHITSPLFSVYGAAKAGLCSFIKNINSELAAQGFTNRILDVSPGSFGGSSFNGERTNVLNLIGFANEIISRTLKKEVLYIPQYETVYKDIIKKDFDNPMKFGIDSYNYKVNHNRISNKKQIVVGYLSGTFDLFHVGHLNLIKKAKENCDYLIVGVHKSGSWKGKVTFIPFDERVEILKHVEYVDKVVESCTEDSDAWPLYHYDKLFVGSDYKGSERFKKYENYFKEKGVEIIYFPYTKLTSSTQIRDAIYKAID